MSKEFTARNPEVRDVAAIFALKGWTWTQRKGQHVDAYVPKATDIADMLNRLLDGASMASEGNAGNSRSGRLFVSWIEEGYGKEVMFGIEWSRLP